MRSGLFVGWHRIGSPCPPDSVTAEVLEGKPVAIFDRLFHKSSGTTQPRVGIPVAASPKSSREIVGIRIRGESSPRTPYLGSDPSQRLNPAHSPSGASLVLRLLIPRAALELSESAMVVPCSWRRFGY